MLRSLEKEVLYRLAEGLVLQDSLDGVLDVVVSEAVGALQADRVLLVLFDAEAQKVERFVKKGPGAERIIELTFSDLMAGLSGWVTRNNKSAISPFDRMDERESTLTLKQREITLTGDVVVAPLQTRGEVFGTLTAINLPSGPRLEHADLDLLTAIANQASVAVANAMDRERLEQLSTMHRHALAEYQAMIDALPDAVVYANPAREIVKTNPAMETIFGYTAEDVSGWTTQKLYASPDDFVSLGKERYNPTTSAGRSLYEMAYRRKSDEVFIGETVGPVVRNQEGEILGYLGVIRDITERLEAEERIKESERRFRAVFDQASPLIALLSPEGLIQEINQAALKFANFDLQQILGQPLWVTELWQDEILSGQLREAVEKTARGEPLRFELELVNGEGRRLPLDISLTPIRDESGEVVLLRAEGIDNSQARALREEIESEREFLNAVLENVDDGIVACNAEGVLTFFNRATREFHGVQVENMAPNEWAGHYDLYLPDETAPMAKAQVPLFRALEGEDIRDVEMVIAPKSGRRRNLLASGRALYDGRGQKIGAVVAMHDITERKRTAEILAERAKRNRLLYEVTSQANRSIDEQLDEALNLTCRLLDMEVGILSHIRGQSYEVTHLYAPATALTRHQSFELGNTYCSLTLHQPDVLAIDHMETSEHRGHPCYELFGLESYIGIPFQVKGEVYGTLNFSSAEPRHKAFSELDKELLRLLAQWVGMALERRQAEESAIRYAEELERSNQELEQFAYVASHDLQEPLRIITGYTQLLSRRYVDILDDDAQEFIGFTVEAAQRMQQLIQDLLRFSRVDARPYEPKRFDLNSTLAGVRRDLARAIEETGADIDVGPLPTIHAEPVQIRQLFQNLLSNALKFRSEESPVIRIRAEETADHWHFMVEDNGIGIESEFQDRIFVIFQRLHTRDRYDGTGIGLALCKKIVERHGGDIWLESSVGEGTTFHFTLSKRGEA